MNKQKENAYDNFMKMIKDSWTYKKMTYEEIQTLKCTLLSSITEEACIGSYDHRFNILNAIYNAYLYGIGYNGWNWRSEEIVF